MFYYKDINNIQLETEESFLGLGRESLTKSLLNIPYIKHFIKFC